MQNTDEAQRREAATLVVSVLIVSICTIVYELLISTLSSYLLGSSVLHFSLTIGIFMFFMGVGSYLSRFIEGNLTERFIQIETWIGIAGGLSAFLLYLCYSLTEYYYLCAFGLVASISVFAGLEIPLVTRMIKDYGDLKDTLSTILSLDYLGALIASLVFPLVFLPYLGVMKTAFVIGILNLGVAATNLWIFRERISSWKSRMFHISLSAFMLIGCFAYSVKLTGFFERFLYQDEIILSEQTPYQRVVMTKFNGDTRLFLNGNIQFSSIDEYRYHEPLVHVPLGVLPAPRKVLILGGGDGLAVREVLKYDSLEQIVLVDLDERLVEIAKTHPAITKLHGGVFSSQKLQVVNQDAFKYVKNSSDIFDAVIIDLPDPNDFSLGKLYSKEFYVLLKKRLSASGVVVTQSSSPYFAREPFWSIHETLASVFPFVLPYNVYVPSFGPWGFNLASLVKKEPEAIKLQVPTRFLTEEQIPGLFVFDPDMSRVDAPVNRLDSQLLVEKYESSWKEWHE